MNGGRTERRFGKQFFRSTVFRYTSKEEEAERRTAQPSTGERGRRQIPGCNAVRENHSDREKKKEIERVSK